MGRADGKVVFITGAARGQGRSHALRLAEEGADIIGVDICADIDELRYPLARPEELEETAHLVRQRGRTMVAMQADVRDASQLRAAIEHGLSAFDRLDVVVANAGVLGLGGRPRMQAWATVVDVNLTGALNTIHAALPHLRSGASIIAIGSMSALIDLSATTRAHPGADPGHSAYLFAKHTLSQYIHELATQLAPRNIRANVVHPTNCDTEMLHHDVMYKVFRPDLAQPTREDAEPAFAAMHAMPTGYVQPEDVSDAVIFLASDEARYITGTQLRVDAGGYLKANDYHP